MIAPDLGERRSLALLAHLYGIRPWEVPSCTATQLNALLGEIGFIRYIRDQPMRDYAFGKLDVDQLISDAPADPAETAKRQKARAIYYGGLYDLPEFRTEAPTARAALAFMAALDAGRVPAWVLNLAPLDELRQKASQAGGGEL